MSETTETIDNKIKEIKDYFNSVWKNSDVGSVSGLLAQSADISEEDIKTQKVLYNTILSEILRQGAHLPKHAHESVVADFNSRFEHTQEDNSARVYFIEDAGIGIKDFYSIMKKEKEDIDNGNDAGKV